MLLKELFDMIEISLKSIGKTYSEIRICGLGDQIMKWHKAQTEKKYFVDQNVVEHISLDWNGKHGALRRDLSKILIEWKNYFDIVTDFGTIEHIENGQYNAFKNVHNFVKKGGAMIHSLPLVGYWKGHCNYHYEADFFDTLASLNKYKCILSEIRNITGRRGRKQPMVCSALIKTIDSNFISEKEFRAMNKIDGLK